MPKPTYYLLALSFFLVAFSTNAQRQDKQELAYELGQKAVALMDGGSQNQAIKLLKKARKLDEENYAYSYEIALAHFQIKDYPAAISEAKQAIAHEDSKDDCYQLLGVIYNVIGKEKEALQTFTEGIDRFPNSGGLYAELGVLYFEKNDIKTALTTWTKGIEVSPLYPTNYFFTSGYYAHNEQSQKAIIHGEIYRNLDPHSDRSKEISVLLFETYKKLYKESNFSSQNDQSNTGLASIDNDLNLEKLQPFRKSILNNICASNNKAQVLLQRLEQLEQRNLLVAYDYWLFMAGDQATFAKWYEKNEQKFKAMSFWLLSNKIDAQF